MGHGIGHGMGHHGGRGGGDGAMGGGMMLSPRMLDAVKATPEQRAQIKQIMDAAKRDMSAQRDANRALRDEAQRVFTQPNVDAQMLSNMLGCTNPRIAARRPDCPPREPPQEN
jgi:Spy/CpxP family protein refolding chaperone